MYSKPTATTAGDSHVCMQQVTLAFGVKLAGITVSPRVYIAIDHIIVSWNLGVHLLGFKVVLLNCCMSCTEQLLLIVSKTIQATKTYTNAQMWHVYRLSC